MTTNPNVWQPVEGCKYAHDYFRIFDLASRGKLPNPTAYYRQLCQEDLFFLLRFGLSAWYADKPFVVDYCAEVENGPYTDTLDLVAREHFKSTILTFAEPIQRIIENPDIRIGIFSHTRPIAKAFLRQIMQTIENKVPVAHWFPEIFWDNPRGEARKWSEEDGIQVKRMSGAKEATIEAWGVVKGQPTSRHFDHMIFDDVVTIESVTSPEMINKTSESMQIAISLGTDGGTKRYIGTHYHYADYWTELRERLPKQFVRIKPATDDSTVTGNPVMLSRERLDELLRDQGPYVFACQQLLNPIDPSQQTFDWADVRFYEEIPPGLDENLIKILLVDPAGSKKKGSDNTAMGIIGVDVRTWNHYLIDGCYEKLDLDERYAMLKSLCLQHSPVKVGYEKYGKDSDIEHIERMQAVQGINLPPIVSLGGKVAKEDRIRRLVPVLKQGRLHVPTSLVRGSSNLIDVLKTELTSFPFSKHDDFTDMLARSQDEDMTIHGKELFDSARIKIEVEKLSKPKAAYRLDHNGQWILDTDSMDVMYVWEEPRVGGGYIVGSCHAQTRYGKNSLVVIDHLTGRQVASMAVSCDLDEFARIIVSVCKRYVSAWSVPDRCKEGNSVVTMMVEEYGWKKIYFDRGVEAGVKRDKARKYGMKCSTSVNVLGSVVDDMVNLWKKGKLTVTCPDTLSQLKNVRRLDDGKTIIDVGTNFERGIALGIALFGSKNLTKPNNHYQPGEPAAKKRGWGGFV